jgi:hypothetical protein
MPVSFFQAELKATPSRPGVWWCGPIDKSKFSLFKPLSLDVIFHDCKTGDEFQRNDDAFA